MFDLILRLRARPLAYRRRVALWSTVGITAFIAGVWALSLSVRFDDMRTTPEVSKAPSPFETFAKQIDAGVTPLKNYFGRDGF